MEKRTLSIKGVDQLALLGSHDENLQAVENAFNAKIVVRGEEITFSGEQAEVERLEKVFHELLFLITRNGKLNVQDISTVIGLSKTEPTPADESVRGFPVVFYGKKGLIRPKTQGQAAYVEAVMKNDIVFTIGPAGTGKTYLAVAMALQQLKEKGVSRIILARPAIEAGESLGFLPGDLMEKIDPYLRPLTDALFDMMPADQLQVHLDRKIIEIIPLAYMRGRTLNDAFVILDEAQNTSPVQMKMFLTRLGIHSKAIVTGDTTQIDLPNHVTSGLVQIQEILEDIEGIAFVKLDKADVVRHRLVREIIQAYETYGNESSDGEDK